MHFPLTYDLEFFRQLTSERVVTRFRFGQPYKMFEQHGRNEALDARVYAMAALEMLRPNYAKLAENLKLAAVKNENAAVESKPPMIRRPQRSIGQGLVRNWRR